MARKLKHRYTVLVCGGRDYDDSNKVHRVLDHLHATYTITYLIHGGAKGADGYASAWCKIAKGVNEVIVPALWGKNKKGAGPIRNRAMRDLCAIDKVVAFPGASGTEDMVKCAKELGIRVMRVTPAKAK